MRLGVGFLPFLRFRTSTTKPAMQSFMYPSNSHHPISRARREYQWLKWATVLALALGCATPLSINLVDPDLWGHLRYGQDWLEEGVLPRTTSHTFTAVDYPWINHENLAELTLALGYKYLGTHGLLIAKCLWGMSILLVMVWVARRHQVHLLAVWAVLLLVAVNLQAFFPLRPQLLSFGLFALTLLMLDRAFCQWNVSQKINWRWLVALPGVFAIWVNAHGGFVLGLCLTGAFLGGRIVDLLRVQRGQSLPQVLSLTVLGSCCILATLGNPYGLDMHRWLVSSLSQSRPEITEWAAPKLVDPIFWPWIALLAVTVISFWQTRLRRDWVQITILLIVAWQSALHLRHIAFLALLCGFWLPPHMQSALAKLKPKSGTQLPVMTLLPWLRRFAVIALALAIGLQSLALHRRLSDLPVLRDHYPVDALQYMADHNLNGKLVVCFNWAQYAIAALAPETQVAFDGRFRTCYPQEVIDMHFDFLLGDAEGKRSRSSKSGAINRTLVLEYGSPDLVLLDLRQDLAVEVMQAEASKPHPNWVRLYQDSLAEVWGRSERYDDPVLQEYVPPQSRITRTLPAVWSVLWPALPERKGDSQLANRSLNHSVLATQDDACQKYRYVLRPNKKE